MAGRLLQQLDSKVAHPLGPVLLGAPLAALPGTPQGLVIHCQLLHSIGHCMSCRHPVSKGMSCMHCTDDCVSCREPVSDYSSWRHPISDCTSCRRPVSDCMSAIHCSSTWMPCMHPLYNCKSCMAFTAAQMDHAQQSIALCSQLQVMPGKSKWSKMAKSSKAHCQL